MIRVILILLLWAVPAPVQAGPPVQIVQAANGLTAWLVQDDSLPLITIEMAWRGGSADETPDTAGLTAMMASLLTEGAGSYSAERFNARLGRRAIELYFTAEHDALAGSLRCLTAYQADCFALLRLALNAPRFDDDAIARVRRQHRAELQQIAQDPNALAFYNLHQLAFANHSYGRHTLGREASVAKLTRVQIIARHRAHIARDNLVLAVVGNINATTLRSVMEGVFGDLPAHHTLATPAQTRIPDIIQSLHVPRDGPQTTVYFGHQGIGNDHPQFFAAYLMNHILGGGGFSSRMVETVRNQRGLAYNAYSYFIPRTYGNLWFGAVASNNASIGEALRIIQAQMADMVAGNISADELQDAKNYLTGAYALRFDSGRKIANELLTAQLLHRSVDYFDTRNAHINAVSLAQVRAAARDLLHPDALLMSSVGGRAPKLAISADE